MTPYRKEAPRVPRPQLDRERLSQFAEALAKVAACRCRRYLVTEGSRVYGATDTTGCPVCEGKE